MKILHINSVCDFGSTGLIARELADYLIEKGHEVHIAYGHGSSTFANSYKIESYIGAKVHNLLFTRILGLHGYGSYFATKRFLKRIDKISPDIIHLGNIHANYLNYKLLFNYIINKGIPVVFTLHDCFNFTGKCHHYTSATCYRWKDHCYNCPIVHKTIAPSLFFDFSSRIFKEKKQFYSEMSKMTVVAVSKWLMNEATHSILAGKNHKITYVYNWIDKEKFYRVSEQEVSNFYKKYNLDTNTKYLISVSQGWNKLSSRYKDAIKLSSALPKGYRLVLVGNLAQGTSLPNNIIHIPYISDYVELAAAYTMSEAYVHLSVEDTFGKVIAEAMSCGTVPITFNSTACGEVPGPYGIIVKPHDINAIVESLPRITDLRSKHDEIIEFVHKNYDYRTNAEQYLNLYKETIR